VFDLSSGSLRYTLPGDTPGAISPDGRLLAIGNRAYWYMHNVMGRLALWDLNTGNQVWSVSWSEDRVFRDLSFSPDGKLIAGSCQADSPVGSCARVWGAQSGNQVAHIPDARFHRFLPNSSILGTAAGNDMPEGEALKFWDTRTWREVYRHDGPATGEFLGFGPIYASSDGKVCMYMRAYLASPPEITTTASTPASKVHRDEFYFIDTNTGAPLGKLDLRASETVRLSADGRTLAVGMSLGDERRELRLYDLPPRRPIELFLLFSALPTLLFTGLLWWRLR
jgi:WD40 repeat protein